MSWVASDWSVDRQTGNIRYIGDDHSGGAPSYATVLEVHRALQDYADDASYAGNDELDITDPNPSDRSTDNIVTLINGYNIDDTASEHIYDGSVIQASGDTIYDGFVNFGNTTAIQIVQNGAIITDDWWNYGGGLNATTGISHRFMLKSRINGVDIDGRKFIGTTRNYGKTYSEFSVASTSRGNNVFALSESDDLNNQTASGTVAGYTTITNTEGLRLIDVDNNGANEEYYSEWNKDTYTINQFYERMKYLTRDGTASTLHGLSGEVFRGITHSWPYDGEAGTGPTTNDEYAWGLKFNYDGESGGPFVVGEALTIGSAKGRLLALDDNGTTGSLVVSIESGTPADNDVITGLTSAATAAVNGSTTGQATGGGMARFLAVDDDGTTGNVYVQLLKGTAPADNAILYELLDHANMITVNGTPTERAISTPFVGVSTGSALIGAYGIGLEATDLAATDKVFDLTNTQRTPPNYVTFTVNGLVSGDRVLVTNDDTGIDYNQMTLNGALTGAAVTAVVVTGAIPADTPATGKIRITRADGQRTSHAYTSWTGSTFTIGSTDFSSNNAANGANTFITYIDEASAGTSVNFTTIYDADRTLYVSVRDGGVTPIKPFESTGTLGSSGGSTTAIRTTDS